MFPNVKGNHIEKTDHPCQFPIELAERFVLALTRKGDLVVDPYAGVGSTLIASLLNGRRSAGAEISSRYIRIAKRRVTEAYTGVLKYRSRTLPVYVPKPGTPLTTPPKHFRFNGISG
jgi:DNA modification methylase